MFLVLVLAAAAGAPETAQRELEPRCPSTDSAGIGVPSRSRNLEGRLIYHDDIRKWFELRLRKPQCGERSIQLLRTDDKSKALEVFRGCQVRSTGPIDFSPTGYYSANLYQDVSNLQPVGSCQRQRPLPDYSNVRPARNVRAYAVDMRVNYGPGDHPVRFKVRSGNRELQPWQAYASYWLTGAYVLYGLCGDGFVVDRVYGPPEVSPGHFDESAEEVDMAMFDPETAAEKGVTDLRLGYTCVRKR